MKRVSFKNPEGLQLAGILHTPKSGMLGEVAVISCHGMLSSKDGIKHRRLAELLSACGLPVLRFDFAGMGESEGRMGDMTYTGRMRDILWAVDYLGSLGVQRMGVFGSSLGGSVAILAAAREERITALATLAAVAHPAHIASRNPQAVRSWETLGYYETDQGPIDRAFYDDALEHDVVSAVRVIRAPLLVIHGTQDDVVPFTDADDIAAAANNVSLHLVDGADHPFSQEHYLEPMLGEVTEFFVKHLSLVGA